MSKVFNMVGGGGPAASIFVTGLSETDTVTAVHKKTVQVPNPEYVVPTGYTQLEYIESTGTQYIDTLLSLPKGYRLKGKLLLTSVTTNSRSIFGAEVNPDGAYDRNQFASSQGGNNWFLGIGGYVYGGSPQANTEYEIDVCNIIGKTPYIKINGVSVSLTTGATDTGVRSAVSCYLFACHGPSGAKYFGYFRILGAWEVYNENEELVGEYFPAKRDSDSTIGMYDLVTSTFFENAGTGTFTAGSEIPQYIETTIEDKTLTGVWTQNPNPECLVPSGYTQLAYLKGDGGQYINVPNFTAGSGTTYSITFSTDLPYNNILYGFFGNSTLGGVNGVNFVAGVNNYSSCGFYTYVGPGGGYNGTYSAGKHTMRVDAEGKAYIDGNHFINVPGLDKEYTAAITIFGEVHGSNPLGRTFIGAIYDLLFEKNGNAYMHFVPAKRNSDSVVGMYDIVNGVFYTNSGTGEFIAGSEVPQTVGCWLLSPIREFGTWTVTATDGTNTATQDVLVDVITDYEIEMSLSA